MPLSIETGFTYTHWSTFKSLDINLPGSMPTARSPRDWRSVWRFNAGVEYQALDWLALRVGYVYDQSPMTERYADYFTLTRGLDMYSAGVGLTLNNWQLDIAYTYCAARDRKYKASNETMVVKSKSRNGWTDMLAISVGYAF